MGEKAKGATGALKWASKGAENAAKTYNNFVYGKDHNCSTVSMCGVRNAGPGLFRGAQLALAATAPWISLLIDPAFTLGFWFSAANLLVGTAAHILSLGDVPMPSIHYAHGGYVIKNAPIMGRGLGMTVGPFAVVGYDATAATIQHELAHVDQYHSMGGWKYMSHGVNSFFGISRWMEGGADLMAGTNAYGNNPYFTALALSNSSNLYEYILNKRILNEIGYIPVFSSVL